MYISKQHINSFKGFWGFLFFSFFSFFFLIYIYLEKTKYSCSRINNYTGITHHHGTFSDPHSAY